MSRVARFLKRSLATITPSGGPIGPRVASSSDPTCTLPSILQRAVGRGADPGSSPSLDVPIKATSYSLEDLRSIHDSPILDLLYSAQHLHRIHHPPNTVQQCTLLSIKTGGCSENCSYCPQSSKYRTPVSASPLMFEEDILIKAKEAKERGSTRFCMGAAWRDMLGRKSNMKRIASVVSRVREETGLEVCCTLGMLEREHAATLKDAGLTAYNHNLDTSREFYPKVITSRGYDDRLKTLQHVRDAGISVCSGGIIGMGESITDRLNMLRELSVFEPESVPINCLVPVEGTPLENQPLVGIWELVRMIATTRMIMPKTMVRLSAGRSRFSYAEQVCLNMLSLSRY